MGNWLKGFSIKSLVAAFNSVCYIMSYVMNCGKNQGLRRKIDFKMVIVRLSRFHHTKYLPDKFIGHSD